jgi:hypothetical protein
MLFQKRRLHRWTAAELLGMVWGISQEAAMSDERFDGKKIYRAGLGTHPEYEIRGKYIYPANSASQAEYEIRGDSIYKLGSDAQVVYDIRGNAIHDMIATEAIYVIG